MSLSVGALKLVGESFPFRTGSTFLISADNHNSVNGESCALHPGDIHMACLCSMLGEVTASMQHISCYTGPC